MQLGTASRAPHKLACPARPAASGGLCRRVGQRQQPSSGGHVLGRHRGGPPGLGWLAGPPGWRPLRQGGGPGGAPSWSQAAVLCRSAHARQMPTPPSWYARAPDDGGLPSRLARAPPMGSLWRGLRRQRPAFLTLPAPTSLLPAVPAPTDLADLLKQDMPPEQARWLADVEAMQQAFRRAWPGGACACLLPGGRLRHSRRAAWHPSQWPGAASEAVIVQAPASSA